MYTSAMLQIEPNDGSGAFIHHFSQDILVPLIPLVVQPIDVSDLVIAILFYGFFVSTPASGVVRGYTILDSSMVMKSSTRAINNNSQIDPPDTLAVGYYQSSYLNPSHGDTVSMVCFTEQTMKDNFLLSVQGLGLSDEQLARLEASSLVDMFDTMRDIGFVQMGSQEFVKNLKLTITRVKPDDFEAVASEYLDVPPFFDAFDLIKERVTRQESSLNNAGYAPAVYTDNGGDGSNDTIVFGGEYALAVRLPQTDPEIIIPT